MVNHPSEYRRSGYHANALGKESILRTPHNEYLQLGNSIEERTAHYQELFRGCLEPNTVDSIRKALNKELALGDGRFAFEIEENFKRRVMPMRVGRKRKKFYSDSRFHEVKN